MPRKTKPKPRIPRRPQGSSLPESEARSGSQADSITETVPVEADLDEELEQEEEADLEVGDILPNGEEVSDLNVEELLDLSIPALAVELSGDPVRLYLREIGQVKLLDADSEFRLATMIEARRLILTLGRRRAKGRRAESHEITIYKGMLG